MQRNGQNNKAMDWYYLADRRKTGPVSETQIRELARQGVITDSTPVWNEAAGKWQPFMNVRKSLGPPERAETGKEAGSAVAPPGAGSSGEPAFSGRETADGEAQEVSAGAGALLGPGPDDAGSSSEQAGERAYCVECGRNFSVDDLVHYENLTVCADCKEHFFQKIREGATVPYSMIYAGFWIRFGAKIIDGIIMAVVNAGISFVGMIPTFIDPQGLGLVGFAVSYLLQLAAQAAYATFFIGKFGATPGKMACNIRVVTADGGTVSYGRALGRHFAEMLSAIILGIGYIMAAFDEEKRALHDRICNTRVIRK